MMQILISGQTRKERETFSKNRASLKSLTSKGNLMRCGLLAVACLLSMGAAAQGRVVTTVSEVDVSTAEAVNIVEKNPDIRIMPFVCDYKAVTEDAVYDSIVTNVTVKSILASREYDRTVDRYAGLVKAQMMKEYSADAIFSPTIEAKTSGKGALIVIVRGRPMKYINFRPATEKDLWILNFEVSEGKSLANEGTNAGTVYSRETIEKTIPKN
jgi:hypothetical protein